MAATGPTGRSTVVLISKGILMRVRTNRAGAVRRAAVAAAEPLEGRSYLSMTIDVRTSAGGKAVTATAVGQVVDLDVYAVISGTTAGSNDAFLDAVGSFLGTKTATGGVVGNLAATLIPTFVGAGASDGTQQDLNGDGGLDVGRATARPARTGTSPPAAATWTTTARSRATPTRSCWPRSRTR